MAKQLSPTPQVFKAALQHYLKTAIEHDSRDPVVSYYCELMVLSFI